MLRPLFITGIGTNVGKTVVSAILTEALQADYWKPVQAGYEDGTDTLLLKEWVGNKVSVLHPEMYKLALPASPHISAREEKIEINLEAIVEQAAKINTGKPLLIEGAGGLMVPITPRLFVADLVKAINARVIIVSRNYLGSINHSLLTAAYCRHSGIDVAGWVFNDDYMHYEEEIVQWSGYTAIASIPALPQLNRASITAEAERIKDGVRAKLKL